MAKFTVILTATHVAESAGEGEEQLVQKKVVPQVYLSTVIARVLLLFTNLPAVMCINRHYIFLHKGENQNQKGYLGETIQVPV